MLQVSDSNYISAILLGWRAGHEACAWMGYAMSFCQRGGNGNNFYRTANYGLCEDIRVVKLCSSPTANFSAAALFPVVSILLAPFQNFWAFMSGSGKPQPPDRNSGSSQPRYSGDPRQEARLYDVWLQYPEVDADAFIRIVQENFGWVLTYRNIRDLKLTYSNVAIAIPFQPGGRWTEDQTVCLLGLLLFKNLTGSNVNQVCDVTKTYPLLKDFSEAAIKTKLVRVRWDA